MCRSCECRCVNVVGFIPSFKFLSRPVYSFSAFIIVFLRQNTQCLRLKGCFLEAHSNVIVTYDVSLMHMLSCIHLWKKRINYQIVWISYNLSQRVELCIQVLLFSSYANSKHIIIIIAIIERYIQPNDERRNQAMILFLLSYNRLKVSGFQADYYYLFISLLPWLLFSVIFVVVIVVVIIILIDISLIIAIVIIIVIAIGLVIVVVLLAKDILLLS